MEIQWIQNVYNIQWSHLHYCILNNRVPFYNMIRISFESKINFENIINPFKRFCETLWFFSKRKHVFSQKNFLSPYKKIADIFSGSANTNMHHKRHPLRSFSKTSKRFMKIPFFGKLPTLSTVHHIKNHICYKAITTEFVTAYVYGATNRNDIQLCFTAICYVYYAFRFQWTVCLFVFLNLNSGFVFF